MGFEYHMAPFSQDDTFLSLSCHLSIFTSSFQPEKQQAPFKDIQGENTLWTIICSSLSEALCSLCGGKSMEWISVVSWFNPSRQLSPHSCSLTPPAVGWGGMGRVKGRKLVGGDKVSLTGKTKATSISRAKQGIHSVHPMGMQVLSHPQESQASWHVTATWE